MEIAMQTDQDLVAELRGSNPSAALAELLRRHGRMVERTVLRRVRDEHLAQDVSQAVFWILLQKAGTLREPGGIGGWLHRTATLAAQNALRVEARRRRHEEAARGMTPKPVEKTPATVWPEGLDEALARLPEIYREAIVQRYLEGRSRSDMSRSMALSDKAVDMRVTRGIERLRRAMAGAVPGLTAAALTGILAAEAAAAVAAGPLAAASIQVLGTAAVGTQVASIAKGAMNAMFWMKMKAIAAVACAATVLAGAGITVLQGQAPVQEKSSSLADVEKLHRLIRPQPGESRWMEIDWYPSVWEARKKAAAEGKPLFLWAGSGGAPSAGC
jgi:RNA polymerase sigma factor (sigma-70 family)